MSAMSVFLRAADGETMGRIVDGLPLRIHCGGLKKKISGDDAE